MAWALMPDGAVPALEVRLILVATSGVETDGGLPVPSVTECTWIPAWLPKPGSSVFGFVFSLS